MGLTVLGIPGTAEYGIRAVCWVIVMKRKKKRNFLEIEFDKKIREARSRAIDEAACGCRDHGSCNHISATWRRRINILKHQRGPMVIGLYGMRLQESFWLAVDRVAEMPKNAPLSPRAEAARVLETLRVAAARKAFTVKCKCPPWEECEHIDYQNKQLWFGRWKKLKELRSTEIGPLLPAVGTKNVWVLLDRLGADEIAPSTLDQMPTEQGTTREPTRVMHEV